MKLETLGEIIASRNLALVRSGQPPIELLVLMGKPERSPDQREYYSSYQIKGFGREKVVAIFGVDAFQAMQLALKMIGAELQIITKDSGGRLKWDAGREGDLGFPVPSSES